MLVFPVAKEPIHDPDRTYLQLLGRAGRPAPPCSRRSSRAPAVAARRRHVDPRDQPPFEALRRDLFRRRSRHQEARRRPRRLPGPLPPRRRHAAVLDGADEPAARRRHRRLPRDRRLVGEGDQGSEEARQRARRRDLQGDQPRPHPDRRRDRLQRGAGLRPHDLEQHHLRHAVAPRARGPGGRAAGQRRLFRHLLPADRRLEVRLDLRRRPEEPVDRGTDPRRSCATT